jgi:hypothetical protein
LSGHFENCSNIVQAGIQVPTFAVSLRDHPQAFDRFPRMSFRRLLKQIKHHISVVRAATESGESVSCSIAQSTSNFFDTNHHPKAAISFSNLEGWPRCLRNFWTGAQWESTPAAPRRSRMCYPGIRLVPRSWSWAPGSRKGYSDRSCELRSLLAG